MFVLLVSIVFLFVTFQASLFNFLASDVFYWIGLADYAQEGVFIWQDSYLEASYTSWSTGQPDDNDGFEDLCPSGKEWDKPQKL